MSEETVATIADELDFETLACEKLAKHNELKAEYGIKDNPTTQEVEGLKLYELSEADKFQLGQWFLPHVLTKEQHIRADHIRNAIWFLAQEMVKCTPKCSQQDIAIKHLENANHWFVKAICVAEV